MANKMVIGGKLALDGEAEYKKALNNVTSSLTVLKSEMKLVSSEFKDSANTVQALTTKQETLTEIHKQQALRVDTLKNALENARKANDEYSNTVNELKNKIASADEKMKALQNSTGDTTAEQAKLKAETDDLTKKLYTAESGLDKSTTSVNKWQKELNYAQANLNGLDDELKLNEKYLDEAKKSTDGTATSIDKYGKEVKEASAETLSFGDVLKANLASEAIIAGVKALGNALKDTAKGVIDLATSAAAYADDIITLSAQTGLSTDTLQEFKYASELVDVSLETLTGSMAKQIKSMKAAQDGTLLSVDAYRRLGIEYLNTDGTLRKSETVYWEIIDALGKMQNETERDSLAMQLLGKSAQDLNPLIKAGSEKMAELAAEARKAGAVLSGETLDGLGETDDALQRLYQAVEIVKRNFGVELAPAIGKAADKITVKINELDDSFYEFAGGALDAVIEGFFWILDNVQEITSALGGIAAGVAAFKAVEGIQAAIMAWKAYKTATTGAAASQWLLNAAQSANPVGLVTAAVAALVTGLLIYQTTAGNVKTATDEANEALKKIDDTYKNSAVSAEAAAKIASDYINRLKELETQGLNTTEAQKEYRDIVDKINTLIPELNVVIDEQTGLITGGTEALKKNTEEWKQNAIAQAMQNKYTEMLQKHSEEMLNAEKARIKLSEAEEKAQELDKKRTGIYQEIANILGVTTSDVEKFSSSQWMASAKNSEAVRELLAEYNNLNKPVQEAQAEINKYTQEIENAETKMKTFNEELSLVETAMNNLTNSVSKTSASAKNDFKSLADGAKIELDKIKVEAGGVEEKIKSALSALNELKAESSNVDFSMASAQQAVMTSGIDRIQTTATQSTTNNKTVINNVNIRVSENLESPYQTSKLVAKEAKAILYGQ